MTSKLAQYFFLDREAIERALDSVKIKGRRVLEIGAGEGVITEAIAKRGPKKLVALELDDILAEKVRERIKGYKFAEVDRADAAEISYAGYDLIIGNIPFYISSKVVFKTLDSDFQEALFWLQKEFAEKMAASEGEFSKMSVMVQSKAGVRIVEQVSRYAFHPVPETDVAIVKLTREDNYDLDARLISLLFQHKNQTVRNALRHSVHELKWEKEKVDEFAEKTGLGNDRVSWLSMEELEILSDAFKKFS